MKYLIGKDKKKRILFENFEKKKIMFKALSKDKRVPLRMRMLINLKLFNFPRNSSKTRIKNRCVFTGRARGVFRYFKASRHVIRINHLRGILFGIKKSSW